MNGHHRTTSTCTSQDHAEQADGDRRAHGERRRNADGLFELRARREGVGGDRRQQPRVGAATRRRLRGLWRLMSRH